MKEHSRINRSIISHACVDLLIYIAIVKLFMLIELIVCGLLNCCFILAWLKIFKKIFYQLISSIELKLFSFWYLITLDIKLFLILCFRGDQSKVCIT